MKSQETLWFITNMITFVMPSINRPTIDRAVKSLIDQTNPNWRLYVVFDGFWAEPPYKDDERISHMFFHPKIGTGNMAAEVRKVAFPRIETPWIGFLDDDDWLDSRYVDKFYEIISKNDFVELICFRMQYGKVVIPNEAARSLHSIRPGQIGISLAIKKKFLYGPDAIFWPPSNLEDFYLVEKILATGASSFLTDEILYYATPRE